MTRELHDPYVIRNRTGYTMHFWKESNGDGLDTVLKKIQNGCDMPLRFHNMKTIRETFVSTTNTISLQLNGPPFESLKGLSIDSEGRTIFILRPKIVFVFLTILIIFQGALVYKIVCEIKLKDNIKYVTFKSTFVYVNQTNLELELAVLDNHSKPLVTEAIIIAPGEEYSIPIEYTYSAFVKVRPFGKITN